MTRRVSTHLELREPGAAPSILEAVRSSGFDASLLGAHDYGGREDEDA